MLSSSVIIMIIMNNCNFCYGYSTVIIIINIIRIELSHSFGVFEFLKKKKIQ